MKNSHGFDGEGYRNASRPQKEWGMAVIGSIDWKGDESVVDLGCGDGVLTAEIAHRIPNGKVLGLDSSKSMIETARKHESSNLSYKLMDVSQMRFSKEFDMVFSNAALHWVPDHDRLLATIGQALKNGGKVRLNFAGDGNCPTMFRGMREIMSDKRFREYFENFVWPWYMPKVDPYRIKLIRAGFTDIEVWMEDADRTFVSEQEYSRFIQNAALVPLLDRISDQEERTLFRHFVLQRILELSKRDDGYFEQFRRINVKAIWP